jgi:hypothetical protein
MLPTRDWGGLVITVNRKGPGIKEEIRVHLKETEDLVILRPRDLEASFPNS